ncbi:DNA-cytosine methyltransferase, partial [methanotrophic bacterial endosymbiont of Bathymodiolus sp.]
MILREYKNPPKFLSLFSGCGGLDHGFTRAGYECLGAFDIDRVALDVLSKNSKTKTYQCDLSTGELPIKFLPQIDVVLAGSPCQGFSTLGKRKYDDPRNQLLLVGGKIAIKHNSAIFIAENVPGVLSGKHKKYWDELHHLLRESGYKTRDIKCIGTQMGLAQQRSRIFLVAWKLPKKLDGSISPVPSRM